MIELDDRSTQEALLGRRVLKVLRATDRRKLRGQRVLITGAGGTIGSALARQVASCQPTCLTLVDQSEHDLFHVERTLRRAWPSLPLEPILGDVSKGWSISNACRLSQPDVVYHTAAYTHVAMTEGAVCAALECNVLGTAATLRAAAAARARFVLISSDKAADPTSVMGATQRLAELAVVAGASAAFRPIVVRFGDVLGSHGSVLELMLDQIRGGLPIQVADLEASRFFMTSDEAAALVLKADLLGETGETYWLDLGGPVKIVDLAMRALVLAAREGFEKVPIEIVGLRPGEKQAECQHEEGMEVRPTSHARVWAARQPAFDRVLTARVLRSMRHDIAVGDARSALAALRSAVPGFEPSPHATEAAAATSVGRALTPVASVAMHRSA